MLSGPLEPIEIFSPTAALERLPRVHPTPQTLVNPVKPITDRLISVAAGEESAQAVQKDRRIRKRVSYDGRVAMVLVAPTGERSRPLVVHAKDISLDGISVVGRQMIYPGSHGAMQLVRSDGSCAIVGVIARSSRYIGEMKHHTGFSFAPLPIGILASEFIGRDGRMVLIDPRLRENIRQTPLDGNSR